MNALDDTSRKARLVYEEAIRRRSPVERLLIARQWTLAMQQLAFAALRQRHPEMPDDEIWLKLAARRLGADLFRKVYGREP